MWIKICNQIVNLDKVESIYQENDDEDYSINVRFTGGEKIDDYFFIEQFIFPSKEERDHAFFLLTEHLINCIK